ncbi:MAG: ABC transporter permease [Pseudoclavibacter sp.]|nr:ABC transporter permease [Pseudoclavibacter sp.]
MTDGDGTGTPFDERHPQAAEQYPVRPGTARPARVRPLGWWYIAEHYARHLRAFLVSELMLALGTPLLYVLAFGAGLGVLVDTTSGGVDGVPYLTFLLPALVCSGALMLASQQYTYTVFSGFKWQPVFLAMSATSLVPWHILGGVVVFALLRILPGAVVFTVIGALVGAVPLPTGALLVPIALLLGTAALPIAAWVGAQREDRGQLNFVERFVVVPLMLFSGTYYPLEVLPQPLQALGWASPLWHAVELGRAASYGHDPGPGALPLHLAVLVLYALTGAVLAERIFRKRLTA